MNNIELNKVLINILEDKYFYQMDKLKEEYWDEPLTGNHFGLTGFDLVELILEFEKRTGIVIDINKKPMYALASINGIIKSIN